MGVSRGQACWTDLPRASRAALLHMLWLLGSVPALVPVSEHDRVAACCEFVFNAVKPANGTSCR